METNGSMRWNILRSAHLVPTKSRTEAEGVALYFMLTTMSVQHIKVYDVDFAKTGRRLAEKVEASRIFLNI